MFSKNKNNHWVPGGFTLPFSLGPMNVYIFDAEDEIAAEFEEDKVVPRGWGRIQYVDDPEGEMSRWRWYLQDRLKDGFKDKNHVVDLLNAPPDVPESEPIPVGSLNLPELDSYFESAE